MFRSASWLVVAGACLAFVAGPTFAADMPAKPMKAPKPAKVAAMPMKPHHAWSCYDYAWESQAMKDCLANPGAAKPPMVRHAVMRHAPVHHVHMAAPPKHRPPVHHATVRHQQRMMHKAAKHPMATPAATAPAAPPPAASSNGAPQK